MQMHGRLNKRESGFTLIELMIVVAIIGILAAIAVPNFINYRNKSRIAAGVGTGESIRAAFASFAADSLDNLFPAALSVGSYPLLVAVANANGGTLKATEALMGMTWSQYSVLDTDTPPDGVNDSYALWVSVNGIPAIGYAGAVLRIAPEGITRCPAGTALNATTC